MPTTDNNITLQINIPKILEFNQGTGSNWGTFEFPFDAIQFFKVAQSSDPAGSTDNIPKIGPNQKVVVNQLTALPEPGQEWTVEIMSLKLRLVGYLDFSRITPQTYWKEIIDIKASDGAIARDGTFYVGLNSEDTYAFITSSGLNDNSLNLSYSLRFVLKKDGELRYCIIDPLMRTRGD